MRLTTKDSIMGRKHDIKGGVASVWKPKLKNYRYELIEEVVDKLGELEDLAEQIGCPLDFVATPYKLSGLKKIWYHNQWCEVVRIVVYEEATKPYMEVRCKDYKYLKMILLEDYGKTWFLDKTELTKEN